MHVDPSSIQALFRELGNDRWTLVDCVFWYCLGAVTVGILWVAL
jgi:hypothetical protein